MNQAINQKHDCCVDNLHPRAKQDDHDKAESGVVATSGLAVRLLPEKIEDALPVDESRKSQTATAPMPCVPHAFDAEHEILSLLGQDPMAFHASSRNHQAPRPTPAVPVEFQREIEQRWADGKISDAVACYYLDILPCDDSLRIPGQRGNPSLLDAVLTEDFEALAKDKATGNEWKSVRAIGKGAYGSVVLWEKPRNGASPLRLALKDSLCLSFFRDYCSEAHLTRRLNDLNCKNVINVVEWTYIKHPTYKTYDGMVYWTQPKHRIAYEHAQYSDLRRLEKWYKTHGLLLPEAFIWHVLYSVANALCYCRHGTNESPRSRGLWDSIVHGDIKQENLFMSLPDTEVHSLYPRIKLADFGLAYTLGGPVTAVQHYKSTHEYGTTGYIAPEIEDRTPEKYGRRRMPHELHGPHSDIYSLGMTCKHLMGLVHRHESASKPLDLTSKQKQDRALTNSVLDNFYSHELREMARRCIAKDPRDRPKTFKLYQESKAQMERHRDQLYAEKTAATSADGGTATFHGHVLYSNDEQLHYQSDSKYAEDYRHALLQPLWTLVTNQRSVKQVRPQLHKRQHSATSILKGVGGFCGVEEGVVDAKLAQAVKRLRKLKQEVVKSEDRPFDG